MKKFRLDKCSISTGDVWISFPIDDTLNGNIHYTCPVEIEYYTTDRGGDEVDRCVIGDSRFPSKQRAIKIALKLMKENDLL